MDVSNPFDLIARPEPFLGRKLRQVGSAKVIGRAELIDCIPLGRRVNGRHISGTDGDLKVLPLKMGRFP